MPAFALALHLPVPPLQNSSSPTFRSPSTTHATTNITLPSIQTLHPTNILSPSATSAKDSTADLLETYLIKKPDVPYWICKTNFDVCLVDMASLLNDTLQGTPLAAGLTGQCDQDFHSCVGLEPGPVVDAPAQTFDAKIAERSVENALENERHPFPPAVLRQETLSSISSPDLDPFSLPPHLPPHQTQWRKHKHPLSRLAHSPGPVLTLPGRGLQGREVERVPDAIHKAKHATHHTTLLTKRAKPTSSTLDAAAGASFAIATAAPEQAPTPDSEAQAGASFNVGAEEVANAEPGKGFGNRKDATGATVVGASNQQAQPRRTCPNECA